MTQGQGQEILENISTILVAVFNNFDSSKTRLTIPFPESIYRGIKELSITAARYINQENNQN